MSLYPIDQVTGLILAGGRGVRVGGEDKGLLLFNHEPIVKRVFSSLRQQVNMVLVSANRHISEYQAFGVPVFQDRLPNYQGPLAGIESALSACITPYLLVVPCDAPFISDHLARKLYEKMESTNVNIVYAQSYTANGEIAAEPMFTLIRTCMLSHLRAYLDSGERKVLGWYESTDHAGVLIEDARCFANANTPEDFQRLSLEVGK
jgi:molybdopterin-guanine dinucleotide biosynthesis protein A